MYYNIEPSASVLKYHGVDIYSVYKDDTVDFGVRNYLFGTDPMVSDAGREDETAPFDIRDAVYESIPRGTRKLDVPYRYDPQKDIEQNLKNLIDLGGIDLTAGREVKYEGYGKISTEQADEMTETRYSFYDGRTNEEKTFTSLTDMLKACGYFAFKLWSADDIVEALEEEAFDKLDRDLTPSEENRLRQMAKSVADTLSYNGIDALTDCTDREWDSLIDAAKRELGNGWLKEVTARGKAKKEKNKKTAR